MDKSISKNAGKKTNQTIVLVDAASMPASNMNMREYYAAHCPITLTEAGVKHLENRGAGSIGDVMDYWADLRWVYADAMIAREFNQ